MDECVMLARVPMVSGDDRDALTVAKGVHRWHAGERHRIKRGYCRQARVAARCALRSL